MMLSHPVLLGLLWCLLSVSSVQLQINNNESNKVYSYTYHFQHNGTTNSKEILQNILGNSGYGEPSDGHSVVKTITNPNIRGFFTKGVLPAGPLNSYNSLGSSGFNSNKALEGIKKIVHQNLQPPRREIVTGLLPVSPDIPSEFTGGFNNNNLLGNVFQNQDDFPKIPPAPPSPVIPNIINNNVASRVQSYTRNTPDGGNVVGKIETFSYNPSPVTNSQFLENSQGYRQNENLVNNNQGITGHRSQSYFRQHFRTITPDITSGVSGSFDQDNALGNKLGGLNNNNNNWWNVLGENKIGNQNANQQLNQNIQQHRTFSQHVSNDISNSLNNVFGRRLSNFNNNVNNNGFSNRGTRGVNQIRNQNNNNIYNNQLNNNRGLNNNFNFPRNHNNGRNINAVNNIADNTVFNNPVNNNNLFENTVNDNSAYSNPTRNNNNALNNQVSNNNAFNNNNPLKDNTNNAFNNPVSNNNAFNNNNPLKDNTNAFNNPVSKNNAFNSNNPRKDNTNLFDKPVNILNVFGNEGKDKNVFNNIQYHQVDNDDTAKTVMNLINNVNNQLNSVRENQQGFNNVGLTWDDDNGNVNSDWSMRQRPFSNAHSGPLHNLGGPEILKTTLKALVGGREIPPISDIGGRDYDNRAGGGVEKFFGVDKVVEGPNSFSRNQQRGYERNFDFNSNRGYQRTNQWSTNTLRRLDAHDSRTDFSKDFIDVFRDDY